MTGLYRLNRGAPAPLPAMARDAAGRVWTDLPGQPIAVLFACGLVEAPPVPAYDAKTQKLVWDIGSEVWVIVALPSPPAAPASPA